MKKGHSRSLNCPLFRYRANSAVRGRDFDIEFERVKLEQTVEEFKKLHGTDTHGHRNVSTWGKGNFEDVCSLEVRKTGRMAREVKNNENLFSIEETRMSSQILRTFEPRLPDGKSVLSLILLDAIMEDELDSLRLSIRVHEEPLCKINTLRFLESKGKEVSRKGKPFGKVVSTPQEPAERLICAKRLKCLPTIASLWFLVLCRNHPFEERRMMLT